ncbi:MAG: ribonuclease III [Deltaproteobacteria bacterium]|nr:ribonuclease III [Deltaproteobacteria bacterium]
MSKNVEVVALEKAIGYEFNDMSFVDKAFCHSSYVNESDVDSESNERLEFLGDMVLSMVISKMLYELFPKMAEGGLTKKRAALVNGRALANIAIELEMGSLLKLGKGEGKGGGRSNPSILSNAFEALIGAVYLDGGMDSASEVIMKLFNKLMATDSGHAFTDYKSRLQEVSQGAYRAAPEYKVVGEEGPPHDRIFTVEAYINNILYGEGRAHKKKDAEQEAARVALKEMLSKES